MFGAGRPWRAYSWPYEIVFALVEEWRGLYGLLGLQLIFALALSLSLAFVFGQLAGSWAIGALTGTVATVSCYENFTLRPQCLVWVLFALLILCCARLSREEARFGTFAPVCLIMSLWANSHVSSVLGLLLIAGWLYGGVSNARLFSILSLAFAATLITPHLGAEWLTFLQMGSHPFSHGAINEFQPASFLHPETMLVCLLLLLLAAIKFQVPELRMNPGRVAVTLILVLAGLRIVKFLPFAAIASGALIADAWPQVRQSGSRLVNGLRMLERPLPAGASLIAAALLGVLILSEGYKLYRRPIDRFMLPVDAVDFFVDRNLPHPILNDFGHGGYLIYRFSDAEGRVEHPAAIDGRTQLIPPDLWSANVACLEGSERCRDFFDKVKPATVLWWTDSPLSATLLKSGEWCRVFMSHGARAGHSLFVRREFFESDRPGLTSDNCA